MILTLPITAFRNSNRRLALLVLSFHLLAISLDTHAAQGDKDSSVLQVVIISVTEFEDDWENPKLQSAYQRAGDRVKRYFETTFKEKANVKFIQDRANTTTEALRQFLRTDFRKIASNRVTLLFILTHGVLLDVKGAGQESDTLLITSNTTKDNQLYKGILLGRDLLQELLSISPGSVVLTFIDACQSGGLKSLDLGILTSLKADLGLKILLIASAHADENSYTANFTNALVSLWERESRDCITDQSISDALQADLSASDSQPVTLIRYSGTLCLDSLSRHRALVVFQNRSKKQYRAHFYDPSDNEVNKKVLDPENVTAVRMDLQKYILRYSEDDPRVQSEKTDVDLSNNKFMLIRVGAEPEDPALLGRLQEQTLRVAEFGGAEPPTIQNLRKLAYATYKSMSYTIKADDLLNEILKYEPKGSLWLKIHNSLAHKFTDINSLKLLLQGFNKDTYFKVAEELRLSGDLLAAGLLFEQYAREMAAAGHADKAKEYAEQAYLALSAVGEKDKAKQIRIQYQLTAIEKEILKKENEILIKEQKNELIDKSSLEELKTMSTSESISDTFVLQPSTEVLDSIDDKQNPQRTPPN